MNSSRITLIVRPIRRSIAANLRQYASLYCVWSVALGFIFYMLTQTR